MPLVKGSLARPAMKEAVVLDLGDLGAQAEKLRRAAEAKAQQIIQQAQAHADALAEGAEERGRAEGVAQGLAEGREQGLTEGREQALQDATEQINTMLEAWSSIATQIDGYRLQIEREARQAVLEFALRLAEKVVHRVVQVDDSVVVDQVGHALSHVLGPLDVTVFINPDDVPLIERAMPQLIKEFAHLQHIHLDTDASIARGGCRAAFNEGQVDATIEKQLERIIAVLLPDAEEGATPQTDEPPATSPAAPYTAKGDAQDLTDPDAAQDTGLPPVP